MVTDNPRIDYLEYLLRAYYPVHFFALFRAHELYNVEPFVVLLSPPILDLGCGDGLISNLLFGHPLEYGIDVSESAVESAKQRGAYKTVFSGDAHTLPLNDDHLGGIFSNCVLEHIPDMPGLTKEIARVLKPGGYFVATCLSPYYYTLNPIFKRFDRAGLRRLRLKMIIEENRLHNHVSVFDVEDYRRMFEASGMTLETQRYYATAPIANFCNKWDTASKYLVPFPVRVRHGGLLVRYLLFRYGRDTIKEATISKWYQAFRARCYSRNESNQAGVGQILVAKKDS